MIICFATVYDAFFYTMQYLTETTRVGLEKVEYILPVTDEYICDAFERTITALRAEGKNPRVAVFDTISSLPGVNMPFTRLTQICKEKSILSCIDGAHGIGESPLRLASLDPDFFTSNSHKWLHVPRPSGFLYVPIRNQHLLRTTLPTGFNFVPRPKPPNFIANFAALSTLDDTPYLCIEAALLWRSRLTWNGKSGESAIMSYTRDLAARGGNLVASVLGTEVLNNAEGTLADCSMVNVRLPLSIEELAANHGDAQEIARKLMKTMIVDRETAVNVFVYGSAIWVRLSAQVYLTLKDFDRAGTQLKEECQKLSSDGI